LITGTGNGLRKSSSGLGLNVGQGYYGRRINQPSSYSAWSGPSNARGPLAMSEEVTRPSQKARHLIVHFAPKIKLHLDCNFVSMVRGVYLIW